MWRLNRALRKDSLLKQGSRKKKEAEVTVRIICFKTDPIFVFLFLFLFFFFKPVELVEQSLIVFL